MLTSQAQACYYSSRLRPYLYSKINHYSTYIVFLLYEQKIRKWFQTSRDEMMSEQMRKWQIEIWIVTEQSQNLFKPMSFTISTAKILGVPPNPFFLFLDFNKFIIFFSFSFWKKSKHDRFTLFSSKFYVNKIVRMSTKEIR